MSDITLRLLQKGGALLESFGRWLIGEIAPLNIWTAALLVGALVLDRALARRARASLRIALYAPVALRIVLPLDWSIHFASAPPALAFFAPLAHAGEAPFVGLASSQGLSWHALAAVVYVAVAALFAGRAVAARVRLGRALGGAQSVDGIHAGCSVVQHDDLGPMVVGLFAPRIVLPRRLLAAGEEKTLACVLRHEVAHLRRHDAWLAAAMQLLAVVAWPVVPLWIAAARVRQLVELACDDAALVGADATERRRYGHALLDMAEWPSLPSLGAGELHFGSTLRARIEALASQRPWPLAVQALALSIAALVLFAACGGATRPAAAPPAGEATDYGYAFEADSSKAATAAPSSAPVPEGPDGRVSPERIQVTVRARFAAFRACYEAGLAKNAKLAGTVTVKSTIGTNGVTKEAVDEKSTLPDKEVVACIVGEFGKLTYVPGSGVVTVVYPIEFAP